jgi:hypothetical protein
MLDRYLMVRVGAELLKESSQRWKGNKEWLEVWHPVPYVMTLHLPLATVCGWRSRSVPATYSPYLLLQLACRLPSDSYAGPHHDFHQDSHHDSHYHSYSSERRRHGSGTHDQVSRFRGPGSGIQVCTRTPTFQDP